MSFDLFKRSLGERLLDDVKNGRTTRIKALKIFKEKTGDSLSESLFFLKSLCFAYLHCTWDDLDERR